MLVPVQSLVMRRGRFYFRERFPSHVADAEVKISLRTHDLKKAVLTCRFASEEFRKIIAQGVYKMVPLSEIRKIMAQFIQDRLEGNERAIASYGYICNDTRKEGIQGMMNYRKLLETAIHDNDLKKLNFDKSGEELLRNAGHNPTQEDIALATVEFMKAELYVANSQIERLTGKRRSQEFSDEEYHKARTGEFEAEAEAVTVRENTLSELKQLYIKEKSSGWGYTMRTESELIIDTFIKYFESENPKAVTHRAILDFRDALSKIPKNVNLKPEFRNMKLKDMVDHKYETASLKTVNKKLGFLTGFFNWMELHDYISKSPCRSVGFKLDERENEKVLPFSKAELVKVFTALRRDKLCAWKPWKELIPLIALYSGMRENEICQLAVKDIILKDGIVCFNITDEGENQRLKSKYSKAIIPLNKNLLKLGFLEYVLDMKKLKRPQLFPLIYREQDGYVRDCSRFFQRFKDGLKLGDKVRFHSFRHNVADNLKQQGISQDIIGGILRHSNSKITFSVYTQDYKPSVLKPVIDKLDYDFDIYRILNVKPLSDEEISKQIDSLFPKE